MKNDFRWLGFSRGIGTSLMDKDRELFQKVREGEVKPFLRFYQWQTPTLSYGRTQGIDPKTQKEYELKGWEIVQRPSGGGNVLHQGDLCYTVVWRKEDDLLPWKVTESYCVIHRWIKISLESLGISTEQCLQKNSSDHNHWCFQSPIQYDILSQGQKIIGGAQWREGKTALHQGSIQLKFDLKDIEVFRNTFELSFGAKLLEEVLC